MGSTVSVPLWIALPLGLLAAWAVVDKLLMPAIRWFVAGQANRVIDELGARLRIGIRPFQRTRRQILIHRLLGDPKVLEAAEQHAAAAGLPLPVVLKTVERYAREIVPAFNAYLYFRTGYWLGKKLAQGLYRVRIGYVDSEGIRQIPENATVVFVMNHRSNMDYVLAGYLAAEQAALSYAVGEWARIWPLSALIRAMGAYFVRRNSRDDLYRRVLERYIVMATQAGVPQAVFPEGGLTRDGRMRAPRLGVIDYMLRGFALDGERDLVFVPLGINYDRVLEDRSLLQAVDPQAERRSRWAALGTTLRFVLHNLALMAKNQWHRFGYACVNIGAPISMRGYCAARGIDFQRLSGEARRTEMAALGVRLMDIVGAIIPVVPVALIARVFVARPDEALSDIALKAAALAELDRLREAGAHLYIPRQDLDYAFSVGLRMLTLRRLVDTPDGLYRARAAELPLLRYYANSIAHLPHAPPAAADAAAGG
jgi:glycerol-3-phosphate O-acyltransferase